MLQEAHTFIWSSWSFAWYSFSPTCRMTDSGTSASTQSATACTGCISQIRHAAACQHWHVASGAVSQEHLVEAALVLTNIMTPWLGILHDTALPRHHRRTVGLCSRSRREEGATLMRASWTFSLWSYSRCATVATEKASLSCSRFSISSKAPLTSSSVSCKHP